MSPAAIYFLAVLATQIGFTVALLFIVVRRFPARVATYRFVAPAAVPILLFLIVSLAYVGHMRAEGIPAGQVATAPIAQFFLAYAVLWLIGVVIASAVIRWVRR